VNGDEVRAHPYFRAMEAVGLELPDAYMFPQFWTRVCKDYDRLTRERDAARGHLEGARADLANQGEQLTQAAKELDLARRPVAVGGGAARPLSLSAQEALAHALTRPQSDLDPRVLYPGECSQAVVEELVDHGLAELVGVSVELFETHDWWHVTVAQAELTPLALTATLERPA